MSFLKPQLSLALISVAGTLQAQTPPRRQFELKAKSPRFWDLFDAGARLEKVAGGFGFTEGPVWDERGFLYVSDEKQNKLSRVFPDGRTETVLSIRDPDGSTFDKRGRLITCLSTLRKVIAVGREATPTATPEVLTVLQTISPRT